ncbi:hypothetical protein LTR53_013027 [Teratosphaeriaceae sp. CCFEE 6253]|nr:hypothetical protein LTR53_013027 [Teratosphaeriaceae sp. CCFEE 6253]
MPLYSTTQALLESIPAAFRVPGGAVAIVKDGLLAGQHVWGFANLETRARIEPTTIFPICSISKQMVCLILTDLTHKDQDGVFETAFTKALHELLPPDVMANKDLTIDHIVGMRSGIRDYWAMTVLWGATPGGRFSIYQDAPKALKRLAGFHFPPGTQMSYCNTNFMVVGLAIEKASGRALDDLLHERLFKPAGMATAALRPDTERIPPPIVGYEGSEDAGYVAYQNRIEWAGDAGIQASLEDMIAYEKYIDSVARDPQSAYSKNAQEPHYLDGSLANYGYGLAHGKVEDIKLVGHGGALAGFRLHRSYAAEKRVSVVVLLNSEADSEAVAGHLLKKVLGVDKAAEALHQVTVDWTGHYWDEETSLAITVTQDKPGEIAVECAGHNAKLNLTSATTAVSKGIEVSFEDGNFAVLRRREGRRFTAGSLAASAGKTSEPSFEGSYHSESIDSTFHCIGAGDMMYGYFDGYLGKGPAHLMRHVGKDVWSLACHRSLDAPAPGTWTVVFHRDGGKVSGATIGCWLARNIRFERIDGA